MRVLLTGASGFIGSRLARALAARGDEVVCLRRRTASREAPPGCARSVEGDFARDHRPEDWLPRLEGVAVVVNAVGLFREGGGQRFEALHVKAPCALFEAAARTPSLQRVVQLSALGADAGARSAYHRSKRAADECLLGLAPLASAVVVQPSLVYGPGGASARLFTRLASLPLLLLPGRGTQPVQPIHVDDAIEALVALVHEPRTRRGRVALVGPRALGFGEFLAALRGSLGLAPAPRVQVPQALVRLGALALGRLAPRALLDAEALDMLERGNAASPQQTEALLGRPPRDPCAFIAPQEREGALALARLGWLLPLLRWSVALLWMLTGIVSAWIWPVADSLGLLARVGIESPALGRLLLDGAAGFDLALGLGLLLLGPRGRRALYALQLALMLFYSVVIAWALPAFWLHPFAPMLKNLPLAAAIVLLLALDR